MYVQDEASRWLTTLQKELDQSVPAQKLKEAKVQYSQLTAKYRDMLQRESRQSERDVELGKLQGENTALKEGLETLRQELELAKEKIHCLNQSHQEVSHTEVELSSDTVGSNRAQASFSRQLAVLEMKELNERERANHAQRLTQQLQASLQELAARNHELEKKFARVCGLSTFVFLAWFLSFHIHPVCSVSYQVFYIYIYFLNGKLRLMEELEWAIGI
uniref:Uncharacterized protein n=1 Tax=Eptatretus burgeri TaxID=7764 RepID=A0A8C4QMM6_EPTBU